MRFRQTLILILSIALSSNSFADNDKKPDEAKDKKKPAEAQKPVTLDGSVKIDGKAIDYSVTASTMKISRGNESANIFYVSYERKNVSDLTKRPVMFCFNGGPGSSAVWLHIGMLGPKILNLPGDGSAAPKPPVRVQDNPQSLLDVCDLVFVDPVSTGYSRPEDEKKKSHFHGLDPDIESCGEFIRRWITEHNRWASPKYILGESYGGLRAAGLAQHVQSRHGMSLNGVILLSAILDYATIRGSSGQDQIYSIYLPTYAAVAHHHGKLKGDRDKLVAAAKSFAYDDYAAALIKGSDLPDKTAAEIAKTLASLTGIPAETWLKYNLRINPSLFRAELLRADNKTLGRFDARVAWDKPDSNSEYPKYDPSYSLALGAFATALKDYLGRDIGYKLDEPYEILTGKVHPWKWNGENRIVNVTDRLATALRDNPNLKVLVMSGHADLATPPECVAYSLRHVNGLSDASRKNISTVFYDAGHMFYLNPPDLKKSRKDLIEFINAN